jgi:molybdopterin/thiamine biosynthesis adenylyltransferase
MTIVGVGALGSHFYQFIRNEDVEVRLIDFDRVEQKNISAQFHSKKSVGKHKVSALLETTNFLWGLRPTAISSKLVENNAMSLLGLNPEILVVDCLDNGASRRLLQDHVRKHGMPCIHGALAADGTYGQVVWDKDFKIDDENVAGEATCDGGQHLPFIGVVSCLLAHAVQTWLRSSKHIGYSISPGGVVRL